MHLNKFAKKSLHFNLSLKILSECLRITLAIGCSLKADSFLSHLLYESQHFASNLITYFLRQNNLQTLDIETKIVLNRNLLEIMQKKFKRTCRRWFDAHYSSNSYPLLSLKELT